MRPSPPQGASPRRSLLECSVAVVVAVLLAGVAAAHAASNPTAVSQPMVFQQSNATIGEASTTASSSSSTSPLNPYVSLGEVTVILAVGAFILRRMMTGDITRNSYREAGLLAIGFVGGVVLAALYIGVAWSASLSDYTDQSALITNGPGYVALVVILVLGLFALRGMGRSGK